ncbi:MAG TPA: hypothetical protein VGK40_10935 [Verrucomicrobiae bacterium]|jgi:hypothetical protein
MKHFTFSLSLAALGLALAGCGKEDTAVQARFKDLSKEEGIKLSPKEREYLSAARPFVSAVAARNYAAAFGCLSSHATARMSLNQFVPPDDDAQCTRNEANAAGNVTPEMFAKWMNRVEAQHGLPGSLMNLYVYNTDPKVLSGRGEPLDTMFAIGAMPAWIPAEIRRASLRGQIATKLTPAQWHDVAKHEGLSVEELQKNPDFTPYFNFKLVLLEEEGELRVGYFEFMPPSMWD